MNDLNRLPVITAFIRTILLPGAALALLAACTTASPPAAMKSSPAAAPPQISDIEASDPYLWLEEVDGVRAMSWVREENARANQRLAQSSDFQRVEAGLRAALDSNARIPDVRKIGAHYYNFWRDQKQPRGVWRRTTLASYRTAEPAWETVLDLDAIDAVEKKGWVWKGAECEEIGATRCLIRLSPGGSDAGVEREFDLATKQWVAGGFELPVSKGGLTWIDRDTVFVRDAFSDANLTTSGYPRVVRRWKRGTSLDSAPVVFEGKKEDVSIWVDHDQTPGFERSLLTRAVTFYTDELSILGRDGNLTKIDAPETARKIVHREWLLLRLRAPWTVQGKTHASGSLLATKLDAFLRGERRFDVLFEPTSTTSLNQVIPTRSHVVVNVLDDVKNRLYVLTPGAAGWARQPIAGLPALGGVVAQAVDPMDAAMGDSLWFTTTNFLTPPQLLLGRATEAPVALKSMPVLFDGSKHEVHQRFATSKDGTRVPYFLIAPKSMVADGSTPTVLYGYGGFEVSQSPFYAVTVGKAWLERGGAFVVANIRGGGEYGPSWHQAALKSKRHRAFEDFHAVAQDLVKSKVTSVRRLGTYGGSNGGLLTGAMLTMYPESFGAVVSAVPLLDMRRYHRLLAGASWMAEYGDPDKPEEWAFLKTYSPYHLFDARRSYPPTFIFTSTKDDRVHPGHARKMAALMRGANKDVVYHENIEGGHSAAANNAQRAHVTSMMYEFFWLHLAK